MPLGVIRSRPGLRFQPGDYIARVSIRRKNRVEDVLYFSVIDHESESLHQRHPTRLERWQAKGFRKIQGFVGKNRKRQTQAFRRLALIDSVLCGEAEQMSDAQAFHLRKMIPEGARLRGASASAWNQVPSGRIIDA